MSCTYNCGFRPKVPNLSYLTKKAEISPDLYSDALGLRPEPVGRFFYESKGILPFQIKVPPGASYAVLSDFTRFRQKESLGALTSQVPHVVLYSMFVVLNNVYQWVFIGVNIISVLEVLNTIPRIS